jgi:hypothetical protein
MKLNTLMQLNCTEFIHRNNILLIYVTNMDTFQLSTDTKLTDNYDLHNTTLWSDSFCIPIELVGKILPVRMSQFFDSLIQ